MTGRAMLIICSGVLISMGYISLGTSTIGKRLTQKGAEYAEFIHAKNAAHTAIQIAMQEINEDEEWAHNHGSGNSWTTTVEGASITLYVDYIYNAAPAEFWKADSIRIISKASYFDARDIEVSSIYLKNAIDYVPPFKGALTLATDNFSITSGGNSSISGGDASGSCVDKNAITVMSDDKISYVNSNSSQIDITGPIISDPSLSYKPTDQLIARLKGLFNVIHISGNYKGSMGTIDKPGVFFVEDYAKLTGGIDEGYGILVVRTDGELAYEENGAELDIAGNFQFNGLVIFENAYNFKGRGTPDIRGTVLVGNTDNYNGNISIDISGNIAIQYDCSAEEYAKKAAALTVGGNRFKKIVTFE